MRMAYSQAVFRQVRVTTGKQLVRLPADALRETSMPSTQMILTTLVAVIAVVGLVQLIIFLAMFVAMMKGIKLAEEYAAEMKDQLVPILENSKVLLQTTQGIITRLEPKLDAAATDLAEITKVASAEAKKILESADEIAGLVRKQAARVDGMTTDALNGIERAGQFVNEVVSVPVRQISGVLAAAKAIMETLRRPASRDAQRGRS
jgi:hypothetical protein